MCKYQLVIQVYQPFTAISTHQLTIIFLEYPNIFSAAKIRPRIRLAARRIFNTNYYYYIFIIIRPITDR